jgi:phenylalanine ammonia-lyase
VSLALRLDFERHSMAIQTALDQITIDGSSLSPAAVEAVARAGTRVTVPAEVMSAANHTSELSQALLDAGVAIYGVTTGFGDSVKHQIGRDRSTELQRRLIDFLGCGTGPNLASDQARAVVLARLNCLARGKSAVRPVVIERLVDLLNSGAAPLIPEQGSVGASGDLVPSSYIAAVLMGEREVISAGQVMPAAQLWQKLGKEPITLQAKEGLALVNGTAFMTGIGCLVLQDALRLARLADFLTALTCETLGGVDGPFHPFIHDAKPHGGQVRSAARIRGFLTGSSLIHSYEQTVESLGEMTNGFRALDVRIQDQYSIRCAPQCIGSLYDTVDWVTQWLTTELNSANDNPLFDPVEGLVHSGGNFSGFHVALAMDTLKTAVASVIDLLDRQLELLVDEKFSNGLPSNLQWPVPSGDPREGLSHGFKGMQIAMSALAAEALNLTMPLTSFSRSTECHNQDKVSMGAVAARRARDVVEIGQRAIAIHLLAACQAADIRGPHRLGATRAVYERVRALSPPVVDDRPLDQDIAAVTDWVKSDRREDE